MSRYPRVPKISLDVPDNCTPGNMFSTCCNLWLGTIFGTILAMVQCLSLYSMQAAEKSALVNVSSPTQALTQLEDSGGLQDIPQGFRRLNSPRSYKQQPDVFHKALKAQVECLPMAFADQLQGHLVDMRSLLGPGVWDRVQQGMTVPRPVYQSTIGAGVRVDGPVLVMAGTYSCCHLCLCIT